jgi:hypothetical protein
LLHTDVAKVNRDIAHVTYFASVFTGIYVVSVCSKCFICFRHILQQVFYLHVAYVSHTCCKCFYPSVAYVSHTCCKCFMCMLHMLHMYIATVCFKCDGRRGMGRDDLEVDGRGRSELGLGPAHAERERGLGEGSWRIGSAGCTCEAGARRTGTGCAAIRM